MKKIAFAILLFAGAASVVSCKAKNKAIVSVASTKTATVDSLTEEWPYENFRYESQDLAFEIDSCNISESQQSGDTIYFSVFPPNGIDIQDRVLRFLRPIAEKGDCVIQMGQNRPFIDSMGPDPILDDMAYTTRVDTLRFDPTLKGFRLVGYTEEEASTFKLDTLAFVKSYKKAVGEVLNADFAPDIAKRALYEEYLHNDEDMQDAFDRLGYELHRIILIFRSRGSKDKVFVFTYGHFG